MNWIGRLTGFVFAAVAELGFGGAVHAADQTILNVSYDPTRELYKEFDAAFAAHWKQVSGTAVAIQQSHGGSGSQAGAVINGLKADVVTLAVAADIDAIASHTGKIPTNWASRLPNDSCPYNSTIVFLVRRGDPKGIRDWGDLAKPGIQIVTPNPKTSGGARWNILAAWAWANKAYHGDQKKSLDYLTKLLRNVPVLDSGSRGATDTFTRRGVGDVLIAWENEAFLAQKEFGADKFDIVTPSISIRADPPVSLVDGNVDAKGTRKVAQAYLQYLYSPTGQKIAAENFYRPYRPQDAAPQDLARFPKLALVTIHDPLFGGWSSAQPRFFADGGVFDQAYAAAQ
jgi:sulfate/thiosulfate transport system substrate-binding protein